MQHGICTTQQIPSVAPSYNTFNHKKVSVVIVCIHAYINKTEVLVSIIFSLDLAL